MQLGRYANREVLNAQILDFTTKKPIMYMDYANTATNEWSSETTYATGGAGGVRRVAFNGEKQATLTFETQIYSLKHLALLAGRDIEQGEQTIFKAEVLAVEEDGGEMKINLSKIPINSQSLTVFKYVNGESTEEVQVTEVTGNSAVLEGSLASGTEVQAFYQWKTASNSPKVTFTAKDFPQYVEIVGDTPWVDEVAGDIVAAQLRYYKAKLQPNFTLNLANSGDPTSLSLTFDIFPVKVNGEDTLADIVVYDEE